MVIIFHRVHMLWKEREGFDVKAGGYNDVCSSDQKHKAYKGSLPLNFVYCTI